MLDKIKQAARALTEPPEFPKRMNTITILEKLQDRSILRAHYEARKVTTSEGPRYEIYAIASVFVTKPLNPPTVGRLNPEGHGPLFTKE